MFTDDDVICMYTREQAIEDGLLFRADEAAKAAGWDLPVVLSLEVHTDFEGEHLVELLRRVHVLRDADRNETLLVLRDDPPIWCELDDDGTATVMYPHER